MNQVKTKKNKRWLNQILFNHFPVGLVHNSKILIIFFFLAIFSQSNAQQISFYNFDVKIDVPSKKVSVNGFINIDFNNKDTITLVLWKESYINGISSNTDKNIRYAFDTAVTSPIMYIPNGRKLVIIKSNIGQNNQSLLLNYVCDFKNLSGWANSFAENWIELNFYCAWFPVLPGNGNFKSKFVIRINDGYNLSGSGIVSKVNNYWEMNQNWGSFDNVIIAGNSLVSKILKKNSLSIQTDFSAADFPRADVDSVLNECKSVLDLFEEIFGKIDNTYLKFVIAPFDMGGYSRKNFVCLRSRNFNLYTEKGIAHEIAHFWWHNASTSSWEDWLNEAFAEYSMLLYIREKSIEDFQKIIDEYKTNTKNLPPVWGIERNSPEAYSVLYEKGSLILYEFEEKVGKDLFFRFLKEVVDNKISNTNDLLELVEKEISKDASDWLKNKLKTA